MAEVGLRRHDGARVASIPDGSLTDRCLVGLSAGAEATMNKGDLIEAVAAELKVSKAEASRTVDTVLECITLGLKTDAKVNIVGFGTFSKRDRGERRGVNPVTKEPMTIPPTKTCGFRPSGQLKQNI